MTPGSISIFGTELLEIEVESGVVQVMDLRLNKGLMTFFGLELQSLTEHIEFGTEIWARSAACNRY